MRATGIRRRSDVQRPCRMESGTTENTRRTGEVHGQTSTRRRRAARGKEVEYMVRIRPKLEALLGNVEELLLATVELQQAHEGREQEEAPCLGIVGMLIHGQEEYAKVLVWEGGSYPGVIQCSLRHHTLDRRQKEDEGRHIGEGIAREAD